MIKLELLLKAAQEPAREMVMAMLPGLLFYLEKMDVSWAVVLYLVIRGLDSYLHENAKVDKTAKVKGLTF